MTNIGDMISVRAVATNLAPASKKNLFQHIAQIAAREYGLDASIIVERLIERERLGTTGFGRGIAIPHGRVDGLNHIVGVFAQLATAIDYSSVDELGVDLVFCLLSPPDAGAAHLKALAQVSRTLRDPALVAKLRGAASPDAVLAILGRGHDARDAA